MRLTLIKEETGRTGFKNTIQLDDVSKRLPLGPRPTWAENKRKQKATPYTW